MSKLQLNAKQIYEKSFNVDFKGYTPTEVDSFLDIVIQDYQNFDKELKLLQDRIEHYEQIIADLSETNQNLQGKVSSLQQTERQDGSMIDLIRRVARLEEVVFK